MRRAWLLLVVCLVAAACGDPASDPVTEPASSVETTDGTTSTTTGSDPPDTLQPSSTASVALQAVSVFFSTHGEDCAAVVEVERSGPAAMDPIQLAFQRLLEGPSAVEDDADISSFFSDETTNAIRSVDLSDGRLSVDFADLTRLNNASTSCGSEALLSQLTNTAFQFDQVEWVRFSMWGSCSLFSNWLQRECTEYSRSGGVAAPVDVASLAAGSGCTPGPGTLPDGVWFGHVVAATATGVDFDLACWFDGVGAIEAALEDGVESPPPNDYHIRDESTQIRRIGVAPDVGVRRLDETDIVSLVPVDYATWVETRDTRPWLPGVWLVVEAGLVASIEEQYQP